jgi:hypothetical protein
MLNKAAAQTQAYRAHASYGAAWLQTYGGHGILIDLYINFELSK